MFERAEPILGAWAYLPSSFHCRIQALLLVAPARNTSVKRCTPSLLMPQTQLSAAAYPTTPQLILLPSLGKLARLASGMTQEGWNARKRKPHMVDASARRADRWYAIAREGIKPFNSVKRGDPLWPSKGQLYLWLFRKHDVLLDALNRRDILPIDVLDAVVRGFSSPYISQPDCLDTS